MGTSKITFLSFRVIFHFHNYGGKGWSSKSFFGWEVRTLSTSAHFLAVLYLPVKHATWNLMKMHPDLVLFQPVPANFRWKTCDVSSLENVFEIKFAVKEVLLKQRKCFFFFDFWLDGPFEKSAFQDNPNPKPSGICSGSFPIESESQSCSCLFQGIVFLRWKNHPKESSFMPSLPLENTFCIFSS